MYLFDPNPNAPRLLPPDAYTLLFFDIKNDPYPDGVTDIFLIKI